MSENPILRLPQWKAEWFEEPGAIEHIAPDWDSELEMDNVLLTHFVAMTMGCTWEIAINNSDAPVRHSSEGKIIFDIYSKRLRILRNHSGPAGQFPAHGEHESVRRCSLISATRWVHKMGWELPGPMLKLISTGIKEKNPQTDDFPRNDPKWRPAFGFKSERLNALYELIEEYYIDAGGKPIPKEKWPAKKSIKSKILINRTLEEADTIITDGKRKGKAKK